MKGKPKITYRNVLLFILQTLDSRILDVQLLEGETPMLLLDLKSNEHLSVTAKVTMPEMMDLLNGGEVSVSIQETKKNG